MICLVFNEDRRRFAGDLLLRNGEIGLRCEENCAASEKSVLVPQNVISTKKTLASIAKNIAPTAVKIVSGAPNAVCAFKKIFLMSKTIVKDTKKIVFIEK
jgi:hypothetical protein